MADNEVPCTEVEEMHMPVVGDVIRGLVIENDDKVAIKVDAGVAQFSQDEDTLDVGTETLFLVEDVAEDRIQVSWRKASQLALWDWIYAQIKSENDLTGRVLSRTRDGVTVQIRGLKAILSQRDFLPGRSAEPQIGEEVTVRIVQYRDRKNQLIVSERAVVESSLEERRAALLDELEVGQVVTGEVRRFASFGAFVDLGGLDALCTLRTFLGVEQSILVKPFLSVKY